MNKKPGSTSTLFVGLLLIFFLSGLVAAKPHPYASERLDVFKEISSDLCQHQKSPKLGQLRIGEETVYFPWASKYIPGVSSSGTISISRMPAKDVIIMNGSNSIAAVEDLPAINSVKLRDIHYNDSQNRESRGNFLGIDVSGITVSAINTMERGSAVATSNIIINPVQIFHLAPEVEEKLK